MCTEELNSKVDELRELRRLAEELAAEITATEDAIKEYMTSEGTDTLLGTDYKITWKEITSSRLDSKSLKADMPELFAAYSKTSSSRRFVVA